MARKQKRRGATKAKIRPATPIVAPTGTSVATSQATRGGRVGGDQATIRAVEMSLGGSVQARGRGRNRVVLETSNPAIPLDRVPFFISDLRQIAIVGSLMVVLLLVANFTVIPFFVK